ncbi:MAG TPA: hypothetical protein DCY07_02220 [Rhodospirillaceae bacterium]|nr:hypothetical protein [Rhodospirillaceae bacterium]
MNNTVITRSEAAEFEILKQLFSLERPPRTRKKWGTLTRTILKRAPDIDLFTPCSKFTVQRLADICMTSPHDDEYKLARAAIFAHMKPVSLSILVAASVSQHIDLIMDIVTCSPKRSGRKPLALDERSLILKGALVTRYAHLRNLAR